MPFQNESENSAQKKDGGRAVLHELGMVGQVGRRSFSRPRSPFSAVHLGDCRKRGQRTSHTRHNASPDVQPLAFARLHSRGPCIGHRISRLQAGVHPLPRQHPLIVKGDEKSGFCTG